MRIEPQKAINCPRVLNEPEYDANILVAET
jgi:hypothetical protein